jgi:hypothetical protein
MGASSLARVVGSSRRSSSVAYRGPHSGDVSGTDLVESLDGGANWNSGMAVAKRVCGKRADKSWETPTTEIGAARGQHLAEPVDPASHADGHDATQRAAWLQLVPSHHLAETSRRWRPCA